MIISNAEALELLASNDLIAVGEQADMVRKRLHPEGIVSFTTELTRDLALTAELLVTGETDDLDRLLVFRERNGLRSVLVRGQNGTTATEYLRALGVARIFLDHVANIEIDCGQLGLKVGQLALRFGANDLGVVGPQHSEERFRALIREAGFLPKKRDAAYTTYSLL